MNHKDRCGRLLRLRGPRAACRVGSVAAFCEAKSSEMNHKKSSDLNKGFTLIEAVMSLALFMILSFGVLLLWQHAARSAENAIRTQNALDNLNIAMNGLLANIELSHTIMLRTESQNVLEQLNLWGLDPHGRPHTYMFSFQRRALHSSAGYKSLRLGLQQYAYGIELIQIVNQNNKRLDITITSVCLCRARCAQNNLCPSRIIVTGSVCIIHRRMT